MAGYVRQSSFIDGDVVEASDHNSEYNQLVSAFDEQTGHKHDGTAAEGPVIKLIGDAGDTTPSNKIEVDTDNNRVGVWIDVSGTSTEQLRFQDGAVVPVTNNDIDLGTSSLKFKDIYLAGTLSGGTVSGITDLAVADGGTGASTATDARTNLGLGTAAVKNTGTSGDAVPLLNAANTWSAIQQHDAALREDTEAMAADNIDWSAANEFSKSISSNTTLTESNKPSSGVSQTIVIKLTITGSPTVTWPASFDWPDGAAPTLATGVNLIVATCSDGTNVQAVYIGGGFA